MTTVSSPARSFEPPAIPPGSPSSSTALLASPPLGKPSGPAGSGISGSTIGSASGNSGPVLSPSVGKPITGSSAPPTSPSSTKEWPPPAPPAPPPAPGPAAVASPSRVGSTPASIAACSCSTSVRSLSLGTGGGASAVGACEVGLEASICASSVMLLSRPRVSCWPLVMAMATAPEAPVTSCSPA